MPTTPGRPHLSVLDRANTRAGTDEAQALRDVVARAQRLEQLGYRRLWVAEHHGVPGIAGSAPAVLMGAVAAATSRLRIGSGGIMVPDHQPLVVAEQIATLQALFPGRIDIGLGRSVGFTAGVRRALRQERDAGDRFAEDLTELQSYLEGTAAITLRPADTGPDGRAPATPLYVLAGGRSAEVAARAGLGVVLGGPAVSQATGSAETGQADRDGSPLQRYRERFEPSAWFTEPTVIVSMNVAVADTEEDARRLLLPEAWALARSRSTGRFEALQPPEELDTTTLTERERHRVDQYLQQAVHGTPETVRARLEEILEATGAAELLVTGGMWDQKGQAASDALLAGLRGRDGDRN